MKKLMLIAFLFPFTPTSFSQVDLSIDSMFHRMGVGGNFSHGLDYYVLFDNNIDSSHVSAIVTNNGSSDATNVFLEVDVSWFSSFYSDTIDLCSGCSDSLFIDPFMLNSFSWPKRISYLIHSDSVDINPLNDSDSLEWFVDCSTYFCKMSRDNDVITDSINNYGGSGYFCVGNVYQAYNDLMITGIQVNLSSDTSNIGNTLIGSIFVKQDTIWEEWATQDHVVNAGDLLYPTYFSFGVGGICLEQGDEFMVSAGHYGSSGVFIRRAQKVDSNTVMAFTGSGLEMIPDSRAVMVRPEVSIYGCGAGIAESKNDVGLKMFPNPTQDDLFVQYSLNESSLVQIEIRNIQGQLIDIYELGPKNLGKQEQYLDLNNLENGVYLITLNAGNQSKTERLIISK